MEPSLIYLICCCSILAIPFAYFTLFTLVSRIAKSIALRLTWLLFILGILFFGSNAAILVLYWRKDDLESGSAMVAAINIVILTLGGRTNPLADYVGVPLHSYYFVHRFVGVLFTAEALLHSVLSLRRRRDGDWESYIKAGLVALGCLSASFLLCVGAAITNWPDSTSSVGRLTGRIHFLLGLGALGGLLWHILLQGSLVARISVLVSCGTLLSTHIYQFGRLVYSGQAVVSRRWEDDSIVRLEVRTMRKLRVFPGCYFYLFFRGPLPFLDLYHGYPMMVLWCQPDEITSGRAKTMSFLISKAGHHATSLASLKEDHGLRLEGPYGVDLCLQNYETVVLTAKGMGIAGILPYALYLVGRKHHDDMTRNRSDRLRDTDEPIFGDLSRHVDLIWWLENQDQEAWIRSQLEVLQKYDEKNLLIVWCVYPSKASTSPGFKLNKYWKVRPGFEIQSFGRELRQETRYPGRMILLACGDSNFMKKMRKVTVQNASTKRQIKFAEVEYQPFELPTAQDRNSDENAAATGEGD